MYLRCIHARCQIKEMSRIVRYSARVAFSHPPTLLLISAHVYTRTSCEHSCIFAVYGYHKYKETLIPLKHTYEIYILQMKIRKSIEIIYSYINLLQNCISENNILINTNFIIQKINCAIHILRYTIPRIHIVHVK